MDPDRVRAYLQVACAGLGFDIGEIWWSQSQDGSGSSALMAIEEKNEEPSTELVVTKGKKLRFVQLYTSKSYEDRRNMLVKPADEEENYNNLVNGSKEVDKKREDNDDNSKHVLSPLLVDAITKTAQVVWAHTRKQEGLLGRSDIRLQTAVGMPVAVDGNGNMCVVVMFSPNNIQSTDDAMDYLQSISRSATCSSIPSLLPAFDPSQGLVSLPHHHPSNESLPLLSSKCLSDGVITRFVSLDDAPIASHFETPEVHGDHDLAAAPKDCFGIPMLPHVSEIGGTSGFLDNGTDAFDEASYGVWSTVMDTIDHPSVKVLADGEEFDDAAVLNPSEFSRTEQDTAPVYAINKPVMHRERRLRLEEFAAAFLGVSVFDLAEVWIPIGTNSDYLGQVTAVSSSETNTSINDFKSQSEKILIKFWSGAVGRAFSSGNPVWSANRDVFVDSGRSNLFSKTKIETALAVPVFSGKSATPSFVFCCYSFVRTTSVPFVLKFVQQALRLLWDGLDKVQPHKSVGEDMWKDVAPADLGEMAADVEMQQHFIIKKRPHTAISPTRNPRKFSLDDTLAMQIGALEAPSGTSTVRSIYTGSSPVAGPKEITHLAESNPFASYDNIQGHIQDAVRSVATMRPVHQHIATNERGSKRAHVYAPIDVSQQTSVFSAQPSGSRNMSASSSSTLPAPRPLPLPKQRLILPSSTHRSSSGHVQIQPANPTFDTSGPLQNMHSHNNYNQNDVYGHTNQSQAQTYSNSIYQYSAPGSQAQSSQNDVSDSNSYQQQHIQPQPAENGYTQNFRQQASDAIYGKEQQQPYEPTSQTAHIQQHEYNTQPEYAPQVSQQQTTQNGYLAQHTPQNVYENEYSQQQTSQNGFQQQHTAQSGYIQHDNAQNGFGQQLPSQNAYSQPPTADSGYAQAQTSQQPYVSTEASHNNYIQQEELEASQTLYTIQVSHQGQAQSAAPQIYQTSSYMSQSPLEPMPIPTPISSIPTHQLSATGITLPANTPTPLTAAQPGQYCMPVDQGSAPVFPTVGSSGKPCRIQGCNEICAARRPYCVRHSGNRMCEHSGCNKCAQGSTRFCIAHGGGRRCTHPGCDKGARDKFFCAAHGGGKRCKADGCNKSAVGGSSLCTAHGGGRRCSVDGCDKSAQSSTKFCVKHGGGKKCCNPDCEKVARGRTQYCAAHGGGVRCKLEGCNRVAIGKLQLCRAHGGGARPRGKRGSSPSEDDNPQQPMEGFDTMEDDFGMESV